MPSLLDGILLRLGAGRLDADLAAGCSPEASARHLTRARRLVSPRMRHALADNWEHLLLLSHTSPGGLSCRAPIERVLVIEAEDEILELIAALQTSGPIPARGVAIAACLISDGGGPIYNPNSRDDLATAIELALKHLDPALPLIPAAEQET